MPEILGVTNPTPSHDSSINNRSLPVSPSSVQIQNAPDLSRITNPDGRTEQQDAGTRSMTQRFDSNFQTFLQRLAASGDISTELLRLLSGRTETLVASGMGEGVAKEFSQFLDMLRMDRSQFLRFLSTQMQAGTRFGGVLFSLLRSAYQKAESDGLRYDILNFLKRYSDHSSSKHIETNLQRNLNQMARSIPARFGNQLLEMLAKLENNMRAGDRAGGLKQLQGEILPFMADYVARTHDLGRARDLLSFVTLDIARYENGAETSLLQSFQLLKNHPMLRDTLGRLDDEALMTLLKNTNFLKAAQDSSFADKLSHLASQAMRGTGGVEAQTAFRELISAFLLNESVYMSVNHMIIPLEWEGKMMFSELWVDPDAEPDARRDEQEGPTQRFLFKIDVESLGFFDVVLTCRKAQVEMQVQCPERVATFAPLIEKNMVRILTDNGLEPKGVRVRKMQRPLLLSEVFPRLFEGKDSVNVKV